MTSGQHSRASTEAVYSGPENPRPLNSRRLLLGGLPPGLPPSAEHLQITDNYITGTRLRLRQIRIPKTRKTIYRLQQKGATGTLDGRGAVTAEMLLSAGEYKVFSVFEGNEIRKNRYIYRVSQLRWLVDLYLGDLYGLVLAEVCVPEENNPAVFESSVPGLADVTDDDLFMDYSLAQLTIDDLRQAYSNR